MMKVVSQDLREVTPEGEQFMTALRLAAPVIDGCYIAYSSEELIRHSKGAAAKLPAEARIDLGDPALSGDITVAQQVSDQLGDDNVYTKLLRTALVGLGGTIRMGTFAFDDQSRVNSARAQGNGYAIVYGHTTDIDVTQLFTYEPGFTELSGEQYVGITLAVGHELSVLEVRVDRKVVALCSTTGRLLARFLDELVQSRA